MNGQEFRARDKKVQKLGGTPGQPADGGYILWPGAQARPAVGTADFQTVQETLYQV